MVNNAYGIEAFMSPFQASIICLSDPGLTAWAMKSWPFRPFIKLTDTLELHPLREAIWLGTCSQIMLLR